MHTLTPEEEDADWQGQELILAALGMKGPQEHSPLQLTGNFKGQQAKMLIDGGSAVNWISSNLSEVLQLEVIKQKPITVTLPNGVQVTSQLKCDSFKRNYENHSFETAVWLMELKEWDVILGVEWLAQLGDLKCNYSDKSLQFIWNKQQVTITPTSQVEILGANPFGWNRLSAAMRGTQRCNKSSLRQLLIHLDLRSTTLIKDSYSLEANGCWEEKMD